VVVVVVADVVIAVVVVEVPEQLEVVPSHLSSVVDESPSSHSRPWQYELTTHELGPGVSGE
jgi:hypothetical protein